jgi:hypothetical protein
MPKFSPGKSFRPAAQVLEDCVSPPMSPRLVLRLP